MFTSGRFQAVPVSNLVATCTSGTNALPQIEGQFPNAQIDSPQSDLSVPVGTFVYFSAPFIAGAQYNWDMGGVTVNSNRRIPGNIQFNSPGTFTITLNITDANGLIDLVPEVRIITVN